MAIVHREESFSSVKMAVLAGLRRNNVQPIPLSGVQESSENF
jgi:hypothetical protein